MGFLNSLFNGNVSNPTLVGAVERYRSKASEETLVDLWQKFLKSRVLLATSAEAVKSLSKIKDIREAVAVPCSTVSNDKGDNLLAVFTDTQAFKSLAGEASQSITMTGEQALQLVIGKGLFGLVLNPKASVSCELKVWQHQILIERVSDVNKLHALATKLSRTANHADAEAVLKAAILAAQRDPGAMHPFSAELNVDLSRMQRALGKLGEAEWTLKRALSIYEQLSLHELDLASTAEELGTMFFESEKPEPAAAYLQKALAIYDLVPGGKPDSIARILCQLADIKLQEKALAEAEQLFTRAAIMLEERKHPELIAVLNKLGLLSEQSGRAAEALAHYARAVASFQTIKRCRRLDLGRAAQRSAALHLQACRFTDARALAQKALEAYRKDGTDSDVKSVELLLEEIDKLEAAAPPAEVSPIVQPNDEFKLESSGDRRPAAQRLFFNRAGKPAADLPLLDMDAVKSQSKAKPVGARQNSNQAGAPDKEPDQEEEALRQMCAFLDSLGLNQAAAPEQPGRTTVDEQPIATVAGAVVSEPGEFSQPAVALGPNSQAIEARSPESRMEPPVVPAPEAPPTPSAAPAPETRLEPQAVPALETRMEPLVVPAPEAPPAPPAARMPETRMEPPVVPAPEAPPAPSAARMPETRMEPCVMPAPEAPPIPLAARAPGTRMEPLVMPAPEAPPIPLAARAPGTRMEPPVMPAPEAPPAPPAAPAPGTRMESVVMPAPEAPPAPSAARMPETRMEPCVMPAPEAPPAPPAVPAPGTRLEPPVVPEPETSPAPLLSPLETSPSHVVSDKQLLGQSLSADISGIFSRSIIGELNRHERFDKPIGERIKMTGAGQPPEPAPLPTTPDVTQAVAFASPSTSAGNMAQTAAPATSPAAGDNSTQAAAPSASPASPEQTAVSAPPPTNRKESIMSALEDLFAEEQPSVRASSAGEEKSASPLPPAIAAASSSEQKLFQQPVDSEISQIFDAAMLQDLFKPGRFERPINSGAQSREQQPSPRTAAATPAPVQEPARPPANEVQALAMQLKQRLSSAKQQLSQAEMKLESEDALEQQAAAGAGLTQTAAAAFTPPNKQATQTDAASGSPPTVSAGDPPPQRAPGELLYLVNARLQEDPRNTDLLMRKGTLLAQMERIGEAIKVFDKVISITPNDARVWYCKGSSLHLLNDFEDALYCFNHVLNLDSGHFKAMLRKAECLIKLGRPDQGMVLYERLLALNPQFVPGWLSKARALLKQGRFGDALDCYEQVLSIEPSNDVASKARSLIGTKLGTNPQPN